MQISEIDTVQNKHNLTQHAAYIVAEIYDALLCDNKNNGNQVRTVE